MAMMEHECRDCKHFWSNNTHPEFACPKCGHQDIRSTSDEGNRATRGRAYAPRRRSRIRRDEFGTYEEY